MEEEEAAASSASASAARGSEEPEEVGGGGMKKGPWTPVEDELLKGHVNRHGEGSWNAVRRETGLRRSGKSCRLRWANHLRPHLKRGPLSPDEEQVVLRLHALIGNKWATISASLKGRTDNEIKNYWNTRVKRRRRAGQSLYPAEVEREVALVRAGKLMPIVDADGNVNDSGSGGGDNADPSIQAPPLLLDPSAWPEAPAHHRVFNDGLVAPPPPPPPFHFTASGSYLHTTDVEATAQPPPPYLHHYHDVDNGSHYGLPPPTPLHHLSPTTPELFPNQSAMGAGLADMFALEQDPQLGGAAMLHAASMPEPQCNYNAYTATMALGFGGGGGASRSDGDVTSRYGGRPRDRRSFFAVPAAKSSAVISDASGVFPAGEWVVDQGMPLPPPWTNPVDGANPDHDFKIPIQELMSPVPLSPIDSSDWL